MPKKSNIKNTLNNIILKKSLHPAFYYYSNFTKNATILSQIYYYSNFTKKMLQFALKFGASYLCKNYINF